MASQACCRYFIAWRLADLPYRSVTIWGLAQPNSWATNSALKSDSAYNAAAALCRNACGVTRTCSPARRHALVSILRTPAVVRAAPRVRPVTCTRICSWSTNAESE